MTAKSLRQHKQSSRAGTTSVPRIGMPISKVQQQHHERLNSSHCSASSFQQCRRKYLVISLSSFPVHRVAAKICLYCRSSSSTVLRTLYYYYTTTRSNPKSNVCKDQSGDESRQPGKEELFFFLSCFQKHQLSEIWF